MFERFDDPVDFRPDADFRAGVHRRASALRRRRRVLAAGASCLAVIGLVGGAGLYVDRRDDAIDRVDVSTEPSTDGATNVLLVGADGPLADGGRADSIAILRFDEAGPRLLSIPRDLYDEAADVRINEALRSGPQAMIDAVQRSTGIPVDHYIALEPQGFVDLVDAAGGLRLAVRRPLSDRSSGLRLEASECAVLDGDAALALARSRRLEVFSDGEWRTDPRADLGRVARQQVMLGAALDQLEADPSTIDRLSRLLADHAVVDQELDLGALVGLGTRLANGHLSTEVLPVSGLRLPSGAQVLTPTPASTEVAAAYGAPHEVPPPTVGADDLRDPEVVGPCE